MASAVNISGNLWLVTHNNGSTERVATTAGDNSASAAIAIATATPAAPDSAALLAEWRAGANCSRFQARAALSASGDLAAADAAVAASGNAFIQMAWAEALVFRRNSASIAALAGAVGLTDTELDALFEAAVLIVA